MTLPLHAVEQDALPSRRCERCRWWAPIVRQTVIGICGHRESAGTCTDKWEGCENFEEKK